LLKRCEESLGGGNQRADHNAQDDEPCFVMSPTYADSQRTTCGALDTLVEQLSDPFSYALADFALGNGLANPTTERLEGDPFGEV
jgi:hypothetical protein